MEKTGEVASNSGKKRDAKQIGKAKAIESKASSKAVKNGGGKTLKKKKGKA